MSNVSSVVPHPTRVASRQRVLLILLAFGAVVATLVVYRNLPSRPFAADDYQWLLNVRDRSFGKLLTQAFDIGAQSHFFRPLVWVLFWVQYQSFALDPRGYHAVNLALHLANAVLLGGLAWRLGARWRALLAGALVALHPAPFEAVVWISAQSELLAATLLLVALHLWRNTQTAPTRARRAGWALLAGLALLLALLTKESAVIGLALLLLFDLAVFGMARRLFARWPLYVLPLASTAVYLAIQRVVEARNYLLHQGSYGFGPQIVLNPLRGLALLVAPLPNSEHADWPVLIWLGLPVLLLLAALFVRGERGTRCAVLAVLLALLPTAPFVAPPNSRYLYPPLLAAALLICVVPLYRSVFAGRGWAKYGLLVLVALLLCAAANESYAREARFAAGNGPGGSLWNLVDGVCAGSKPKQIVLVDPPIAPPHVQAIVQLACGRKVQTQIVGRAQLAAALGSRTMVVAFPNGTATVEQTTP